MPPALVRKRCFVQMIGYEPVGVEHQHRRFIREMARFQKAWNVSGSVSPLSVSADGRAADEKERSTALYSTITVLSGLTLFL